MNKAQNNSNPIMNLRDIILKVIDDYFNRHEVYSVSGVVSEINETARVCTVTPHDDSAPILNVRLQASTGLNYTEGGTPEADTAIDEGVVFIPVDGSDVVVTFMNKDHGYIGATTKIAKVIGKLDKDGSLDVRIPASPGATEMSIHLDKNGLVFNGGNKGPLAISDKLVERYNKIEDDNNNLRTAISGWTPVTQDGGAALKIALQSWLTPRLTNTVLNDIKNDEVKQ